jgi:GAF domain-containing protein
VGDTLRDVFHTQDLSIRLYDRETGLMRWPYFYEHGERLDIPAEEPTGFNKHIIATKEMVFINHDLPNRAASYGSTVIPGTDMAKSMIAVPIITSDQVSGVISIENHEREGAFSESDQRLLTTLSASLSVALENARLFEETKRLLEETQQRNQELAVINRVGQSLATQLDPLQIFELVGETLCSVFDSQVIQIITYDRHTDLANYRYQIEKGERFYIQPRAPMGFSRQIIQTRQPIMVNHDLVKEMPPGRTCVYRWSREASRSV